MMADETQLWRANGVECVMVSCCSGAELQLRAIDGEVLLRELYPTKSDLYERAQMLATEYSESGSRPGPFGPGGEAGSMRTRPT
jgi:hypothetical protein